MITIKIEKDKNVLDAIKYELLRYCLLKQKMTHQQTADFIGISRRTLRNWINCYPEFYKVVRFFPKTLEELRASTYYKTLSKEDQRKFASLYV